jgi:uncharacterized protein YbbC (DUF1343 family)
MKTLKIFLAAGIGLLLAGTAQAKTKVLLGIDMLERGEYAVLKGKRIGLITNHTGRDRRGKSTLDLLYSAPGVRVAAVFAPEHGLRGDARHGEEIRDGKDTKTGLPVYSLYGKNKRPSAEMLKGLDALVFDIQDIGTRFYTYTTTLAYAMEEAAKMNLEFIVLDRPNPISGAIVEGEPLDPSLRHFTAYLKVPVRHGFTVGEIANWYDKTAKLGSRLTVVKMDGWSRGLWWDQTGLKFRPTSPNIRSVTAAALYPGIGCFEATNISVGRGAKTPFELIRTPWINGEELAEKLNFLVPAGIEVEAARFTPKDDLYKGELCQGVRIKLKDRDAARPFDFFLQTFMVLTELYPEDFKPRWDEIALVTGSMTLKNMLDQRHSTETILQIVREKADRFAEDRKPYLLYK